MALILLEPRRLAAWPDGRPPTRRGQPRLSATGDRLARARVSARTPRYATHDGSETTDSGLHVDRSQTNVAGGHQSGKTNRCGPRSRSLTSRVTQARHPEQPQPESEPHNRAGGAAGRLGEHRGPSRQELRDVDDSCKRHANQCQPQPHASSIPSSMAVSLMAADSDLNTVAANTIDAMASPAPIAHAMW